MLARFGGCDHLADVHGMWRGQEDRFDQRVGNRVFECSR
jgi:hypothetical protein